MTPSARLAAVAELLSQHFAEPQRPLDHLIAAWLRGKRYVGGGDRRAILSCLYGIQRNRAKLLWHLMRKKQSGFDVSSLGLFLDQVSSSGPIESATKHESGGYCENSKTPDVNDICSSAPPQRIADIETGRALVLAAQILIEKQQLDALAALFDDHRYGLGPATRADRALIMRLSDQTLIAPDMPEWVALECPQWADLKAFCPEGDFAALMTALNTEAALDIRVNTLVMDRETAIQRLTTEGISATKLAYTPSGIRLGRRVNLAASQSFKDGGLEPQDQGAQIAALLCDAQPGDRLVDFCAGAGGKTLAFAASMQNRGYIMACDVLEGRLKRGQTRFKRAKVHNVETRVLISESDPWVKHHKAKFDKVVLDVPCSGTGVWRRNPEARWRHNNMTDLTALIDLQSRILRSATRLCKPGGMVAYITCSLLPAENADQVRSFLAEHSEFHSIDLRDRICKLAERPELEGLLKLEPEISEFGMQLWPHRHDSDGFFVSLFHRKV